MGLFRLYNSPFEEQLFSALWKSYSSLDKYTLNELSSDSRPTIEFTLMQRNPDLQDVRNPWSRMAASSYSVAMGLFRNSDRGQLTYLDTFTNLDEFTKQGTLLLDTAAINAIMTGAVVEISPCTFEIIITDTSGNRIPTYRNTNVTLKKPLIGSGAAVSPDPTNPVATVGFVQQTFVPRDGTSSLTPCQEFYLQANGLGYRVYIDTAGRLAVESFAL